MEILAAYPWQITDTIFGDTDQYLRKQILTLIAGEVVC